jgi:HSP20 family protein
MMNIRDLIPWSRGDGREVTARREGDDPMLALQSDINRVFENFWRSFDVPMLGEDDGGLLDLSVPRVDIREGEREVEVLAELPGMDEDDVDVSIAEGMLTIRGEKKAEREEEEQGYILRERTFGRVERVVPLPDGLDLDAAEATFKNGVLTVRIPKTAESQALHRRIQVQRG